MLGVLAWACLLSINGLFFSTDVPQTASSEYLAPKIGFSDSPSYVVSKLVEFQAEANTGKLVIPNGFHRVDGVLHLPPGCIVQLDGIIIGRGRVVCHGSVSITGKGRLAFDTSANYWIEFRAGNCSIEGIEFRPYSKNGGYGIGIIPALKITHLRIYKCKFNDMAFAILRNPSSGLVESATISGNQITDMSGDGIEWNSASCLDTNVVISNNKISDIASQKPNQGIGIGIAGASYRPDHSKNIRRFKILGNRLSRMRQAIHVEAGSDFEISRNVIQGVSSAFSKGSGIETAAIACYGCKNFQIKENKLIQIEDTTSILIGPGVVRDKYISQSINYQLGCNQITGGTIHSYSTGDHNKVIIYANRLRDNANLSHSGACNLEIKDNHFSKSRLSIDFFSLNPRVATIGPPQGVGISITDNIIDRKNMEIKNISSTPIHLRGNK